MAKKATTKKRKPGRETPAERDQREYRERLARATKHAEVVNRLSRRLRRAIDRNVDQLCELAQTIVNLTGDTIEPDEPSPVIERPAPQSADPFDKNPSIQAQRRDDAAAREDDVRTV